MDAHYNHHHRGYVQKLNELIKGTMLENQKLIDVIRYSGRLRDEPKFNSIYEQACQHYCHSLYWNCLGPSGEPPEGLDEFVQVALTKFGDGWVCWLKGGTTVVLNDTGLPPIDTVLIIDVWEHAYYLDYMWEREKYVDAFLRVVDWDSVKEQDTGL